MKNFKKSKGITLIALVVTIVVLLILAAVSIGMLAGENGIIAQAQKSKEATEQAKVEEIVDLAINALISENNGSIDGITPKDIADKINSEYSQYENVYAEDEANFPTNIIFPEENNRKVEVDLNEITSGSNSIYDADVLEEDIAPTDIFNYEIISDAETGATSIDSLPTKKARITGIKVEYCNKGGYNPETELQEYTDTNYEIVLKDGSKITDTLVVPYQVEINGEMYKITETDISMHWYDASNKKSGYMKPLVETIIYPNTIEKIYTNASGNSKIKKIILSKNLKELGDSAISGCSNLTNIQIPNSVITIGNNAFNNCDSLTNIVIPNNVKTIGNNAFWGCDNLTSIKIPSSVTSIGNSAFDQCKNLTSIEIPNSITNIGDSTFNNCDNLTSIKIPNSVTSIGNYAFSGCSSLTNIEIPSSVTKIESSSFSRCSGLTSIKVDDKNPIYNSKDNCNAIIETNTNILIKGCKNTIIPNSVTIIGDSAFATCYNLTSIEIPSSVTSIGKSTFENCYGLTSIEIPSSVTSIGSYAFYGCRNLTSMEIPSSVTTIESSVFSGCSSLNNIVISNGVTSIGSSAFSGCSNLTSIEIPSSVTSVKNYAFNECSNLTTVNYNGTTSQWQKISIATSGNDNLKNAQIICTDGTIN